jgi:Raf kinase inhibitor-like YbhB/YbcL family protein
MRRTVSIALAAVAGLMAGCGAEKVKGPPPSAPARITLSSPAFADGATIPRRFTCEGGGDSPALDWRGVPSGARSLALLVEDPDAAGGTYVHWTAWGIPVATRTLPANADPLRQGKSSGGKTGYEPPCPPEGDGPHRYVFALYALRAPLDLEEGASPDEAREAIGKAALARGTLIGRYER